MMMAAENSVEDYWEDASVSWGCRDLSLSSLLHTQQDHRDGPLISKQDFHITSALVRPRHFPPPITLCTTLSIKVGGRFVLKEIASLPPHSFRAERGQGRLCLHLIEPKDSDEDEEEEGSYDNVCNVEDASVCAHLHHQPDGYKTLATEIINENITSHEQAKHDSIQGTTQELEETVLEVTEDTLEMHARTREAEKNAVEDTQEASTSKNNAVEHIDTRDNSCGGGCIPSTVCANEIESKNEGSAGAYMGMLGIGQHRFRKNESSNDIAASLSPCSSKQVLSFARTSPPLGLAVS